MQNAMGNKNGSQHGVSVYIAKRVNVKTTVFGQIYSVINAIKTDRIPFLVLLCGYSNLVQCGSTDKMHLNVSRGKSHKLCVLFYLFRCLQ